MILKKVIKFYYFDNIIYLVKFLLTIYYFLIHFLNKYFNNVIEKIIVNLRWLLWIGSNARPY